MSIFSYCDRCKFHNGKRFEKDGDTYTSCLAFPNGIPKEYSMYDGVNKYKGFYKRGNEVVEVDIKPHDEVVKGQVGNYVFTSA